MQIVANPVFNAQPGLALPVQQAACSAGRVALGGGYELLGGGSQLSVLSSTPVPAPGSGWRVVVKNNTASAMMNAQVRVYVICAVMQ